MAPGSQRPRKTTERGVALARQAGRVIHTDAEVPSCDRRSGRKTDQKKKREKERMIMNLKDGRGTVWKERNEGKRRSNQATI